jgi:hypothetical protein
VASIAGYSISINLICLATPKVMNDLDAVKNRHKKEENFR